MPAVYTIGQVLPNGATVTADSLVTESDGTTIETMNDSAHNQTTIITLGANSAGANAVSLQQKAQTALTANATYLAIASPTNAQVAAQVAALTKQCNALIRLAVNQFDSVTGT